MVALEDEADGALLQLLALLAAERVHRLAVEVVFARPSRRRAGRGCGAASTCRRPTGPMIETKSPVLDVEVDAAQQPGAAAALGVALLHSAQPEQRRHYSPRSARAGSTASARGAGGVAAVGPGRRRRPPRECRGGRAGGPRRTGPHPRGTRIERRATRASPAPATQPPAGRQRHTSPAARPGRPGRRSRGRAGPRHRPARHRCPGRRAQGEHREDPSRVRVEAARPYALGPRCPSTSRTPFTASRGVHRPHRRRGSRRPWLARPRGRAHHQGHGRRTRAARRGNRWRRRGALPPAIAVLYVAHHAHDLPGPAACRAPTNARRIRRPSGARRGKRSRAMASLMRTAPGRAHTVGGERGRARGGGGRPAARQVPGGEDGCAWRARARGPFSNGGRPSMAKRAPKPPSKGSPEARATDSTPRQRSPLTSPGWAVERPLPVAPCPVARLGQGHLSRPLTPLESRSRDRRGRSRTGCAGRRTVPRSAARRLSAAGQGRGPAAGAGAWPPPRRARIPRAGPPPGCNRVATSAGAAPKRQVGEGRWP